MFLQAEADMELTHGYIDDWNFESNSEELFVDKLKLLNCFARNIT